MWNSSPFLSPFHPLQLNSFSSQFHFPDGSLQHAKVLNKCCWIKSATTPHRGGRFSPFFSSFCSIFCLMLGLFSFAIFSLINFPCLLITLSRSLDEANPWVLLLFVQCFLVFFLQFNSPFPSGFIRANNTKHQNATRWGRESQPVRILHTVHGTKRKSSASKSNKSNSHSRRFWTTSLDWSTQYGHTTNPSANNRCNVTFQWRENGAQIYTISPPDRNHHQTPVTRGAPLWSAFVIIIIIIINIGIVRN